MKHKRGAPFGNQNARKHGFYSRSLNTSQMCEFLNITNVQNVDREIALLRIKLESVLKRCPDNRRVLLEAAKLLVNRYTAMYHLNREERNEFKKHIRFIWGNIPNLSDADRAYFLQNGSGTF